MHLLKSLSLLIFLTSLSPASYNEYYHKLEKDIVKQNPVIIMQKYKSLSVRSKRFGDFMLPDLDTTFMIMNSGFEVTASQMIPFPTKIYAKSKQLNINYKAAKEQYNITKSQIISEFKFYYISLYFLENKIKILKDNLAIIKQLESQISSQVISGKISTSKLLFIQIEQEKLRDTVQRTETQKLNLVKAVSSLFDNKVDSNKLISAIKNTAIKEYTIRISIEETKNLIQGSSIYKKKKYEIEQVKYMKQLKYNKFLPDLMLETSYSKMNNSMSNMGSSSGFSDNLQFMFSLQLPITVFKRTGELNEIGNLYKAGNSALENVYNAVEKNILVTVDNYKMNKRSYNTYKSTLKETAEQNFIEMQSKYITSKNISALDFLEAFRKLLDIDLMILKYQVEMEKNIIMLERITTKSILRLNKYFNN